ncbi:MAG: amino acid--tRNA ligase-related protein [Pseudonocardiaceae bacterium]
MDAKRIAALDGNVSRTWNRKNHYLTAMRSPWYQLITRLQDTITHASADFWRRRGVRNLYLPITTSSISSPMGLGSDSLPVEIDLFGVRTYLADSMQFMLEYGCRLNPDGTYYIMPSFRGEAADSTHLCQFFHSEAEIAGNLDAMIDVVEEYLSHLATAFLQEAADDIRVFSGNLDHLEQMAKRRSSPSAV